MKNVTKQGKPKEISSFQNGSIMYELVGDEHNLSFIRFDAISELSSIIDSVTLDDQTLIPPQNDLVSGGTIHLPNFTQEYGSTSELYEDIKYFIGKYVDVPERFLIISTLYVMLTWIYDCFDAIPYLRVVGDFGTGKSRFLFVTGRIAYKACFAGGATSTSPIFRINEIYKGVTLVFDEADFKNSGSEADIVKILNCGYMKGMPVLRTEGDGNNRVPKGFDVYGPKIIATRNQFQDAALESRCLTQVMAGRPRPEIPRHLPKQFYSESAELRNKLLLFRLRNFFKVELDPSQEIDGLEPRINQVALPILSIIEDESVREEVIKALTSLQSNLNDLKQDQEPALILRAVLELIKGGSTTLTFKEVAKQVNEISGVDSEFSYTISPAKIGRVNKSVLALETYLVNGVSRFKTSIKNINLITNLCKRYAINEVDDVDLVELCFGKQESLQDQHLLEEVQNSLL